MKVVRKKVVIFSAISILVILATGFTAWQTNPEKAEKFLVRKVLGIKCIDYKQAVFSKKLNNIVPEYLEQARKSGIIPCKDDAAVMENVRKGSLVKVKEGKGYTIEELTHSYPYITPAARELLEEAGRRFREKVSGTRLRGSDFTLTSVTRTTESLKQLQGVNGNASLNSPHLFGNTFDISYRRFETRRIFLTPCDEKFLMEALAEVIFELKQEKKCWATYERQQTCYHVVVR
jgi:hypothetical protein